MKFAGSATATATPQSLAALFNITDFVGARRLILETAGTVNYGSKGAQPGLVGTRLELENSNPKDVYVSAASVVLTLIIE